MVDVCPSVSQFPIRPPTPPREKSSTVKEFGEPNLINLHLSTPDESPASGSEYFKSTAEKIRKKVGFTGYAKYHSPSNVETFRALPASRDCSSVRSILKPSPNTTVIQQNSRDSDSELSQTTPLAMIRSAINHLASADRASRLDAYSSLLGSLSTYEDVPKDDELAAAVLEIATYIQRELTPRESSDESQDLLLLTKSLQLLAFFLVTPKFAALLSDDFRVFVIEYSLRKLEDETLTKSLVIHYLHILERQKFGSRILNAERINRLLIDLRYMTHRVNGNRIVGFRLAIYQRLLSQNKAIMAQRFEDWFDILVSGLFSMVRDIRKRAISFGIEAGLQLGTLKDVSNAFVAKLSRQSAEGQKCIDRLCSRLSDMTKSKVDATDVPQVWIVLLMFLRHRPQQIEHWEHLLPWLKIIQLCFNAGDPHTKLQANIAWSRFSFAVDIGPHTSDSMANILRKPIAAQLTSKRAEETNEKILAKQVARSAYCTLLYYALRPLTPNLQIDRYWKLYVTDMMPQWSSTTRDIDQACAILAVLFHNDGPPKVWDANRANLPGSIQASDLPCLDQKWIRSRFDTIMPLFYLLLQRSNSLSSVADTSPGPADPIIRVWSALLSAVANASSKEIKTSPETISCIAQMINQMVSLLKSYEETTSLPNPLEQVKCLLEIAVKKLGILAFSDKRLKVFEEHKVEAASDTPSSRSRNTGSIAKSAAEHLLECLLRYKLTNQSATVFAELIEICIRINISSETRHTKVNHLRSLGQRITRDEVTKEAGTITWRVISSLAGSTIRSERPSASHGTDPSNPGHEYRDIVRILEYGLQLKRADIQGDWICLFQNVISVVTRDVGALATSVAVISPLADVLIASIGSSIDNATLNMAVQLVEHAQWPQSRNSFDRVNHQLWGTTYRATRSALQNVNDSACALTVQLLTLAYQQSDSLEEGTSGTLLKQILLSFKSCTEGSRLSMISQLQSGLAIWVEDKNACLGNKYRALVSKVDAIYEVIIASFDKHDAFDVAFLQTYELIILAGLKSRHRSIASATVELWNRSFSHLESAQLSGEVRKILAKLSSIVTIDVKNFSGYAQEKLSPSHFVDAEKYEDQQDATGQARSSHSPSSKPMHRSTPLKNSYRGQSINAHGYTPSPLRSSRRSTKQAPKLRLRHDDSQMHFTAVESSPIMADTSASQMLTDRQREVQERQQQEAAIFPNLSLPKLSFPKRPVEATENVTEQLSSPAIAPDAMMNHFLGSSPTPSSSRRRNEVPTEESDLPSSPPSMPAHTDKRDAYGSTFAEPHQSQIIRQNKGSANVLRDEEQPNQKEEVQAGNTDQHMLSDFEIFHDAQTDPIDCPVEDFAHIEKDSKTPIQDLLDKDISPRDKPRRSPRTREVLSKHMAETCPAVLTTHVDGSLLLSDTDPVTAQLLHEMSQVSSQSSQNSSAHNSPAQKSKKRKAVCALTPRKRPRTLGMQIRQRDDTGRLISIAVPSSDCISLDPDPAEADSKQEENSIRSVNVQPPDENRDSPPMSRRRSSRVRVATTRQQSQAKCAGADNPRSHPGNDTQVDGHAVEASHPTDAMTAQHDTQQTPDMLEALIAIAPIEDVSRTAAEAPALSATNVVPDQEGGFGGVGDTTDSDHDTRNSLLGGFRKMLAQVRRTVLEPEDERAIVTTLFECVQEAHAAGRRYIAS